MVIIACAISGADLGNVMFKTPWVIDALMPSFCEANRQHLTWQSPLTDRVSLFIALCRVLSLTRHSQNVVMHVNCYVFFL